MSWQDDSIFRDFVSPLPALISGAKKAALGVAAGASYHYLSKRAKAAMGDQHIMESIPGAKYAKTELCKMLTSGIGCGDVMGEKIQGGEGASWAPGASGAPVGSVAPVRLGTMACGSHTRKFKATGGFFIQDSTNINTWTNIPWEYGRMFIGNEEMRVAARESRFWRTKNVTLKLKNPVQMYEYTAATGTTMVSQNMQAQLISWKDRDYTCGLAYGPGFTSAQYLNWCRSFQFGGFNRTTDAKYVMPVTQEMDLNPGNASEPNSYPTETGPDTEVQVCNVGSETVHSYTPLDHSWRRTIEFLNDPCFTCQYSSQPNLVTTMATRADQGYPILFRNDNLGCFKYNDFVNGSMDVGGFAYMSYEDRTLAAQCNNCAAAVAVEDNLNKFYSGCLFRGANTSDQQCPVNLWMHCMEEHPQPQLWVCMRNLLSQDFSSLQTQNIQVQFEYEWEIEFWGHSRPSKGMQYRVIGLDDNAAFHMFSPNIGVTRLDPTWYAKPFYNLIPYNNATSGAGITPLNSGKCLPNSLAYRYTLTGSPEG